MIVNNDFSRNGTFLINFKFIKLRDYLISLPIPTTLRAINIFIIKFFAL